MSNIDNAILMANQKGYYVDNNGNCFNKKNKTRALSKSKTGYLRFNIRIGDNIHPVMVHKLQAYQKFDNKVFDSKIVVRHKNGNPFDNSIDNILIGSQSENQMDIPKQIRKSRSRFSNIKYNHDDIISDYKSGLNYKEIMEKHLISSKGTLSFIINKSIKATV